VHRVVAHRDFVVVGLRSKPVAGPWPKHAACCKTPRPAMATPAQRWLRSLPKSLVYQFAFAAPPMLLAAFQWPQVPRIVRAALVRYPTILLLYAPQGLFWYDLTNLRRATVRILSTTIARHPCRSRQ
jgi:hypothetical protein